ncbi:hypothetical protein [Hydrogenophaga sp.]|uniref:hypothetical protein n=1 Tax=Hydrogenophaga sp. TaxID=1904254 RepID=UPI002715E9ED|nr:hypothetical protein [Hydrogenophaga sp.]MDO8905634.1 hypothetical protein [Hydrogenophaga sp.]
MTPDPSRPPSTPSESEPTNRNGSSWPEKHPTTSPNSDSEGYESRWWWYILLTAAIAALLIHVWGLLMYFRVAKVVSIGPAISVTPADAGRALRPHGMVVETADAFYPLFDVIVLKKGEELKMEIRETGTRFICNSDRSQCARTPSQ